MRRNHFLIVLLFFAAHLIGGSIAGAQDFGFQALGLRGGLSVNPDQVHFGVYAEFGQFAKRVRFQPSFELGLGDDVRLGAVNLDALYLFKSRSWRPYAGGGLGVNFIDADRRGDGLDVEAALNLVGGFMWGRVPRGSPASHRYLLEIRVGIGDTPELKVTAGFTL